MIAIVHETVVGDKLDRTLAALTAGEYRLRPTHPTDAATSDRITATLEPRTLLRSDTGLQLPLIDLMDHVRDADEASAIAHAVECLRAPRVGKDAHRRIEDAIETIVHASIGAVPCRDDAAVDVATATPWRGFSIAWWRDDTGPRDGTTPFEPAVPVDGLIPTCVLIDHFVDADAHGRLGISAVRSTVHASGIDPDPVETLRRLVDLKDGPIAACVPSWDRLLLIPSPDLGTDASLIPRILTGLTSGRYMADQTGIDASRENPRVLRPCIDGLPILALSRGSDEDGRSTLSDAIVCLSRPIEPDTTLPRLKAAMSAIMRSAGPARPEHPSMLCRTASPWGCFVAQSYAISSDEADMEIPEDVQHVLPPAVIVQRGNLDTGERCLRIAPIYAIAQTAEIMDVDAIETLRVLKDLAIHPLDPAGDRP